MNHIEIAAQLARDFTYVSDVGADKWTRGPMTGPVRGDCDDFSATALYRVEGSEEAFWDALEAGRATIHFVRTPNDNGHAVLEHRDFGFIDNMDPVWRGEMNGKYAYDYGYAFSASDVRKKMAGIQPKTPKQKKLTALMVVVAVVVVFAAINLS